MDEKRDSSTSTLHYNDAPERFGMLSIILLLLRIAASLYVAIDIYLMVANTVAIAPTGRLASFLPITGILTDLTTWGALVVVTRTIDVLIAHERNQRTTNALLSILARRDFDNDPK